MSRSTASILVFSIYLALLGTIFALAPNALLTAIHLAPTQEGWIRMMGFLLWVLAFYYLMAARTNTKIFYRWTLYTRLGAVLPLTAFVLAGWITPLAILFWLGDLTGALWTWAALRVEGGG